MKNEFHEEFITDYLYRLKGPVEWQSLTVHSCLDHTKKRPKVSNLSLEVQVADYNT